LSSRVFKKLSGQYRHSLSDTICACFQTLKQAAEILEKEEEMAKDDEFNETDDEVEVLGQASAELKLLYRKQNMRLKE
jgi:hypothetical protein